MKAVYLMDDLKQIRALSDPMRLSIIEMLTGKPRTIADVAAELGVTPNKLYYHVSELEKVGLVRVARSKQKGNLVERYYQAVAKRFVADRTIFKQEADGLDVQLKSIGARFEASMADLERAIQTDRLTPELLSRCIHVYQKFHLQEEDVDEFINRLGDLFKDFKKRDDPKEATRQVAFTLVFNTYAFGGREK